MNGTKENKIGILIYTFSYLGGVERRFLRLWNFLIRKYNYLQVVLITTKHFFSGTKDLFFLSVKKRNYILINENVFMKVKNKFVRKIIMFIYFGYFTIKYLRKFKLIHITLPPSWLTLFITLLCRLFNVKITFSIVNSWRVNKSDFSLPERVIYKLIYKLCWRIDFLSKQIFNAHSEIFRFSLNKGKVSPCSFTDYKLFSAIKPIYQRNIDICFLSRFIEGKGLPLLLEVIKLFLFDSSNLLSAINFHIVGDGPMRPLLINFLKKYYSERNSKVFIKIYVTNFPHKVLLNSKVFLSFQEKNNYPSQTLLEAMAAQCGIIALNTGETDLLIKHNYTGILVTPNPEEVKFWIIYLLSNLNYIEELGKNARNFVMKYHTIEHFSKYFVKDIIGISL